MTSNQFVERFGGSFRTKHLMLLSPTRKGLPRRGLRLLRGPGVDNRRPYVLPVSSELPAELIRLDPWEGSYLFTVAERATRGIVEIGRLRGGSTFLLACANPDVPIWSIDNEPEDDESLRALFAEHGVGGNVHLLVGDSQHGSFPEIGEYDLLFVDGDHSYDGCSADLANHFGGLTPGGQVLLHDSYEGNPVQSAVLDFMEGNDVEIVRSPYIIHAHWQTSYGSIAHLRKRPQLEPAAEPARRRRARQRRWAGAAVGIALGLFTLFGLVPEALNDWPYNPIGKDSRVTHEQSRSVGHADG